MAIQPTNSLPTQPNCLKLSLLNIHCSSGGLWSSGLAHQILDAIIAKLKQHQVTVDWILVEANMEFVSWFWFPTLIHTLFTDFCSKFYLFPLLQNIFFTTGFLRQGCLLPVDSLMTAQSLALQSLAAWFSPIKFPLNFNVLADCLEKGKAWLSNAL